MVTRRRVALVCALVFIASAAAIVYSRNLPNRAAGHQVLEAFEFHREPARTPEAAAEHLFRGVAFESPKHFVRHLLLGVCDGSIDTLQKFAESLHMTTFRHGEDSFGFYELRELRRGINRKKPIRIVASLPFDEDDTQVKNLQIQMISTYYGQSFVSVDVAAEGYDGKEYQTRVVTAQVDGGWYAIPRCSSARSFYAIADAMTPFGFDAAAE